MQLENYNFLLIGRHIKYGIFNVEYNINTLLQRGIDMNDIEFFFSTRDTMNDPCFQSYLTRDFYNMVYGDKECPKEEVVQLGHGPCFVVTKELILQHPITIYEKLIDTFYPNKGHWTEWKDHSADETYFHLGKRYHDNLLRFWTILFTPNYSNKNIKTDYSSFIFI